MSDIVKNVRLAVVDVLPTATLSVTGICKETGVITANLIASTRYSATSVMLRCEAEGTLVDLYAPPGAELTVDLTSSDPPTVDRVKQAVQKAGLGVSVSQVIETQGGILLYLVVNERAPVSCCCVIKVFEDIGQTVEQVGVVTQNETNAELVIFPEHHLSQVLGERRRRSFRRAIWWVWLVFLVLLLWYKVIPMTRPLVTGSGPSRLRGENAQPAITPTIQSAFKAKRAEADNPTANPSNAVNATDTSTATTHQQQQPQPKQPVENATNSSGAGESGSGGGGKRTKDSLERM